MNDKSSLPGDPHAQTLDAFGLFLAAEFSGAKAGEWRCPMIGFEAAVAVVEAIAACLRRAGQQEEDQCHSSDVSGVGDCAGTVSRAAQFVANARAWLDRQIVKDGREALLDEGDCRLCGSPAGEGHEPTDPCGIVEGLLAALPPPAPSDEEMVSHLFNSRTPYEPGDDRDIWCKDCEYHRDHQIHSTALPPPATVSCPICQVWTGYPVEVIDHIAGVHRPAGATWQGIETAPKDGGHRTPLLVGFHHHLYGWLWGRGRHYGHADLLSGYWVMEGGGTPTHWMPLPPVPAPSDQEPTP